MFYRLKALYFDLLFRLKRFGLGLLGGLLLFSSVLMLLGASMIYVAAINWPQTKGQLLRFDLQPLPKHPSHLKLDVAFRYSVNGKNFQGQYFSPMTRPGKVLRWFGRRKQDQYRVGQDVDVIFDPRDPSVGYLETPDLFWDILLLPVSIGLLSTWMLYLFVKTRRRTVPASVANQAVNRFEDHTKWQPIMHAVIERDFVVLRGRVAYSATGGLFSGWPQCNLAVIASPNEFAVVPGPFTKRGIGSTLLTLVLEFSLSRFWLPAAHGTFFLVEVWRRRRNWRYLNAQRYDELLSCPEDILVVPIDDACVFGYDASKRRLWYRLPGQHMDESLQLLNGEMEYAEELIAYISLMQQSQLESEG